MTANLNLLKDACAKLLQFNDLWVIGNLTDTNFEEGDRSVHVKRLIDTHEQAGMPEGPLCWLREGTNGLLAQLIARKDSGLSVRRNKWAGQDLLWGPPEAKAEVKLVHDCILAKYYESVISDYSLKLCGERAAGFRGDLFLIVFFVQLPRYQYPSGSPWGKRALQFVGIETQFAQLSSLPTPVWRSHMQPLRAPDNEVAAAIERRFRAVFRQSPNWQFDLSSALAESGVMVSIWEVP